MKTFSITTLGCRVNHYEAEQIATLLRSRGLHQAPAAEADLRIVHTCSVTTQAASKSRQSTRRLTRLAVFGQQAEGVCQDRLLESANAIVRAAFVNHTGTSVLEERPRVVVTGCWATSDPQEAAGIRGVDAVLGHHCDVAGELTRLLDQWQRDNGAPTATDNGPRAPFCVKGKLEDDEKSEAPAIPRSPGITQLPQLKARQSSHQRAFLKVQDGCDAHCTYCIIPQLRPALWSKPLYETIEEARRLVDAGHVELVLTGIFLGAYGQPTALRRRQPYSTGKPLGELVEALCTEVKGLRRLRLSSLEPGDVSDELLAVLRSHPQVVPHFHVPLQSGSDTLLHRMNRQYTRNDFLQMVEELNASFDRPALTTDIIVGFPGETDEEFDRTVEVARQANFIHIHAFSFSPRPRTAAARWTKDYIRGPVVNQRIDALTALATQQSRAFRQQFVGHEVEILIERPSSEEQDMQPMSGYQHGRCERYFSVHVEGTSLSPGTAAKVQIEQVTTTRTFAKIANPTVVSEPSTGTPGEGRVGALRGL